MSERPEKFHMSIQGGMLEALGINMYTTLGKCLVEFIANSYDSDATYVDITIPEESIKNARKAAKEKAKSDAGQSNRFAALLEVLPEEISVVIRDDGHGMAWKDIEKKYLPLNRKRRTDSDGHETILKSEKGSRYVMGRKGIGKLAGFGVAETVRITSKRKGDTYSTTITMRDDVLKVSENVTEAAIPAEYDEELSANDHGTTIELHGLKSDALRQRTSTLKNSISEAFHGVRTDDFCIRINGNIVISEDPDFVVMYPEDRMEDGFAEHEFEVEDIGKINFKYFVGFREKSLPAGKRGARVYCNNRLAAGPDLYDLPTGMHSFHSSDYMECVVEVDELDRSDVDFINTNRSQLRDTEVVRKLITEISGLMKKAIPLHARYRDRKAEEDLNADETGRMLSKIIEHLPAKTKKSARRLLSTLAAEFGVSSDDFRELAPVVLSSINATDVLVRLVDLRTNPDTIKNIAHHLRELGKMERSDALKLYRARRNGITALEKLWKKGEEEWRGAGIESDLHRLLKQNPWLIRPEFSKYTTSDQDLSKVASQVAEQLKLDEFTPATNDGSRDQRRPDLVFLMADRAFEDPCNIYVVELKSPTLPLESEHYWQLEKYIYAIKDWARTNVRNPVSVSGLLIGAMPRADVAAMNQKHLLEKFKEQGAQPDIRIIGLNQLIRDARIVHGEAIQALEDDEDRENNTD